MSNRKQYVFYNGSFSQVGQLQWEAVLFSIFTNDQSLVLNHITAVMYADHTTLYMPAKAINNLTVTMNSELQSVITRVNSNKLLPLIKNKKHCIWTTHCIKK